MSLSDDQKLNQRWNVLTMYGKTVQQMNQSSDNLVLMTTSLAREECFMTRNIKKRSSQDAGINDSPTKGVKKIKREIVDTELHAITEEPEGK